MSNTSSVEHQGVVEEIDSGKARVRFVSHPSCASCHARGACSLSDTETKFVESELGPLDIAVGDKVDILLESRLGLLAVVYGYVLPLIILMVGLSLTYFISRNEGLAAITGLGLLIPYYAGLYLFRRRLANTFRFRLRKQLN